MLSSFSPQELQFLVIFHFSNVAILGPAAKSRSARRRETARIVEDSVVPPGNRLLSYLGYILFKSF